MTEALDAATAACRIILEIHHKRTAEDFARAALRGALPAEPTPEMVDAIALMMVGKARYFNSRRAYRALRAHLLAEDA